MILFYFSIFCRLLLLFIFGFSFITKLFGLREFFHTITRFNFFPSIYSLPIGVLVLLSELTAFIMLAIGGRAELFGFSITTGLLSVFLIALIITLNNNIKTSCNCFGVSQRVISIYDIWRNSVFLAFSVIGISLNWFFDYMYINTSFIEFSVFFAFSITFFLFINNLEDIHRILLDSNKEF